MNSVEWLEKEVSVVAELIKKGGDFVAEYGTIFFSEGLKTFPEESLIFHTDFHFQQGVIIPVIYVAKYAKTEIESVRFNPYFIADFREIIEKNNLSPMGYKNMDGRGMAFSCVFLNNPNVKKIGNRRVLRYVNRSAIKSFRICSNCDAYERLNVPVTTTERGRCENPDFLNKIIQTSIYPAWNTKACGYFDLVDPEDSIKIDFEKIEHDMFFNQESFISAFFKDKREELENV